MSAATIPADLLEITRDDFADATKLDQQAAQIKAAADAIRGRALRRVAHKLGLGPADEINLETGEILLAAKAGRPAEET